MIIAFANLVAPEMAAFFHIHKIILLAVVIKRPFNWFKVTFLGS